ncbi:MAG: bifunctional metallophosphatase/5'-nucleotidase, partial [Tissierellia bacterium]|nr:bifunctional metallophosphatase/5'-nucleotidase [Tissierellia bacterium]
GQYIDYFKGLVQEQYLNKFNMAFDEVLAYAPFNFPPHSQLGKVHGESTLGNLISDSYIYTVKAIEGEDYEPIRAAVVPKGTIRSSFVRGNITVADVFNVSSLGVGPDKVSGYPLISVYLTGKELKTAAEVDASITPIMDVAQLYISGLNYTFNPNRLIFNKVTDVYLVGEDGLREEIEDNKLYRVVAGLYSAQMLSVVGDKSFGLMSIVPKDKEGNPIENFDDHVIMVDGHEVKEWWALAYYLKSFDKIDGLPQIPDYYAQPQGRKVVDNSKNIITLLKNPNKIALMFYGLVLVLIVIIVFVIRAIRRKRRKGKSKYIL